MADTRAPRLLFCCLLALLAFVLVTPGLVAKPFYTRGEPREALVSQGMLLTGNWISPPAYGGAVPSKPPLTHWLSALASLPGGEVTETTARLPSQVAYVAFGIFFFLFLARRTSERHALLATLVLLTSVEWFRAGATTRVDMMLAATLAGGLIATFQWFERGMKGVPLLAWILFAAASLTKGPVGVVLPAVIWTVFLLTERTSLRKIVTSNLTLFVVPLVPYVMWSIAALETRGGDFLAKIYYENVARFTSTMEDEPHKKSALYLYGTLLLGFMPWTVLLLAAVASSPKNLFLNLRQRAVNAWQQASQWGRFSFLAVALILVFFSIPSSKRSVYLLPLYPFAALGIAHVLELWTERRPGLIRVFTALMLVIVLIAMSAVSLLLCGEGTLLALVSAEKQRFQIAFFAQAFRTFFGQVGWFPILSIIALLIGVVAMIHARWRACILHHGGAPILILLLIAVNATVIPAVTSALSERPFAESIRAEVVNDDLTSFGDEFYGTSFYLKQRITTRAAADIPNDGKVILFEENVQALRQALSPGRDLVVLRRSEFGVIQPEQRAVLARVVVNP